MEHDEQTGPIVSCIICNAENAPIGTLGMLWHYNCRQCGMWYSAGK